MADKAIPVWTLSTSNGPEADPVPSVIAADDAGGFTADRLARLRQVLAAYADEPPVLMERHAIAVTDVSFGGRVIAPSSPILRTLSDIAGRSSSVTPSEQAAGATGVLYRMVVPKGVAGDLAAGLARPMPAAGGGQYSAILGKAGVVAQARYVPVASAGGATGAAATATTAAGVGGAAVAAAPVVILLAATAASVYAEEQRQRALERLQASLDQLRFDALNDERDRLNGAVKAIFKATTILADEGRLGHSLGLDASVHAIDIAISTAERRLDAWEKRLSGLGSAPTPAELIEAFPGIDQPAGEFTTKLRLVVFAVATKRRVSILQAAEHTQINPDLTLSRFARELERDMHELEGLERRVADLLRGIAGLEVSAPRRTRDIFYTRGEVRDLLSWSPRLQHLAAVESPTAAINGDVEIGVLVPSSGPARVLEPVTLIDPHRRRIA